MRWKDFLYFQKSDQVAIVLLLILIVLTGGCYLITKPYFKTRDLNESKKVIAHVESFQHKSKSYDSVDKSNDIQKENSKKQKTTFPKLTNGQQIELNTASIQVLKQIPGVGDEFARRILNRREQLGGFCNTEQLLEIKGVTKNKYNKVIPFVRLTKKHNRIRINKCNVEQLVQHPYIDKNQAGNIVKYRSDNKKISSIEELCQLEGFTPRDAERLAPYLRFD